LTEELRAESLLSSVIRQIQDERKKIGLSMGDTTQLVLWSSNHEQLASLKDFVAEMAKSTNVTNVQLVNGAPADSSTKERLVIEVQG